MLAEVQALVTPSTAERPRRTTSGLDGSRVAMVLAVLQQHAGIRLHTHDVFASTVGGARIAEPAADLAVAVAVASACQQRDVPTDAWWRSARSAWPASCAGSATCRSGSPRRPGSASGSRSCRPSPAAGTPGAVRTVDGMQVIGVPDIDAALRVLDLGVHDAAQFTRAAGAAATRAGASTG